MPRRAESSRRPPHHPTHWLICAQVPAELAYIDKARPAKNSLQIQDCEKGRGPVPPNMPERSGDMGAGEYQRFKNIYCNPNRPYQPDLVLDVRLFGRKGG